jgi:hypothetical protein
MPPALGLRVPSKPLSAVLISLAAASPTEAHNRPAACIRHGRRRPCENGLWASSESEPPKAAQETFSSAEVQKPAQNVSATHVLAASAENSRDFLANPGCPTRKNFLCMNALERGCAGRIRTSGHRDSGPRTDLTGPPNWRMENSAPKGRRWT